VNERHVEPGADVKREREGKDWKGKGVRERERDGRRRDYSFAMSNYRKTERGCSREREAGSKDPRTAVDAMGFRCVGGQPVQWVCQHSGVKRGFPRTNVWRVLWCGEGECNIEGKGGEKSFRIKLVGGTNSKTKSYRGLHF